MQSLTRTEVRIDNHALDLRDDILDSPVGFFLRPIILILTIPPTIMSSFMAVNHFLTNVLTGRR